MGGEKQVTIMVLKVDLQCCKCHEKVKKILYKIPYILDQTYDEKDGTVTIKVECCSPEKIKEKIFCKGGDTIKSIEIKVPEKPKPKPPAPKKETPPKEPEKPNPTPPEKPKVPPPPPPCQPVPGCPPPLVPIGVCCQQCHNGYPGGPSFHGRVWPPPCYQYPCYCGRPDFDSCGCGRNCYMSRCDIQGCTFM